MCLVSYIPLSENSFVLSSNRDEAPDRAAVSMESEDLGTKTIWFPKDTQGGSWYFVSSRGEVLCLLNGAFEIHRRVTPYKMSRGQMLKAYFNYESTVDFLQFFDFWNIEPFTMVICSTGSLIEFRWDGRIKHVRRLDPVDAHVWSSCTLYTTESQQRRRTVFNELLGDTPFPDWDRIVEIHRSTNGLPKEEAFVMQRDELVKTISITQARVDRENIDFRYFDLIHPENDVKTAFSTL